MLGCSVIFRVSKLFPRAFAHSVLCCLFLFVHPTLSSTSQHNKNNKMTTTKTTESAAVRPGRPQPAPASNQVHTPALPLPGCCVRAPCSTKHRCNGVFWEQNHSSLYHLSKLLSACSCGVLLVLRAGSVFILEFAGICCSGGFTLAVCVLASCKTPTPNPTPKK